MRLPSNMTDARFGVSDAAAMVDIPETRLRDWLARCPIAPIGSKPAGRIWFTGWEIVVLAIMRDLVDAGYTPHLAMNEAFRAAGGPMPRVPAPGTYAIVGLESDTDLIARTGKWPELSGLPSTAIVVPVARIHADIEAKVSAQ